MIYCSMRDCYVEQDDCCVLCKFYKEETDSCKRGEEDA
jgi:hypothetical protein